MRLNLVEAGDGAPVILLHGLFGAAQNWGAVQRHLAARHRVLALDLRNHGASGRAAVMDYPAMAEDVAETMQAFDAAPAVVIGHSMGGKVAMTLALAQPSLVARLVVVDIAPIAYPPALRPYIAAMRAIPLHSGLTRREADAALATTIPEPGIRAFLVQNLRMQDDPPRWRLALDEIDAAMPVIEGFPDLPGPFEGPTLVIDGERSSYIRPDSHPRFRSLFPAARFATVAGVGHWVHAENPAGFLALVDPFLD